MKSNKNFNMAAWEINLNMAIAKHESGMTLRFKGKPNTNNVISSMLSDVRSLSNLPQGIKPVQFASLLKHGYFAYRAQYENQSKFSTRNSRVRYVMLNDRKSVA